MSTKRAATQGTETLANNVKNIKKENGVTAAGRQNNEIVIRKPEHSSGNSRGSDGSKSASPSKPSEAEHSTDTDGDGAEADDENEENEPKKDGVWISYGRISYSSFALFNIIVLVRSILFKLGSVLPGLTGDVETRKLLDFVLTKAGNYQR